MLIEYNELCFNNLKLNTNLCYIQNNFQICGDLSGPIQWIYSLREQPVFSTQLSDLAG